MAMAADLMKVQVFSMKKQKCRRHLLSTTGHNRRPMTSHGF